MIDELTKNFTDNYKFNLSESSIKSKKSNHQQKSLIKLINHEFKKDFIKKLYHNPIWTNRVYWNVIGRIQIEHDDISLDNIVSGVDQYLDDNNMCINQRDLLKFIYESINTHKIDGLTNIKDVLNHAAENGVNANRFNEAIKHMKADGKIFEPEDGFYKSI